MFRRIALLALVASVAAGCGASPNQAKAKKASVQTRPIQPLTAMGPVAGAPGGQPGAAPTVQQILAQVDQLRSKFTGAKCELNATMRDVEKGTTARLKANYTIKLPNTILLAVIDSNTEGMIGTKLSWDGNATVKIKTKFIGFWVNTSLPASDDRLKDAAGYKLSETSVPRMFQTLLHPQSQTELLGMQANKEGVPMYMLKVTSPLRLKPATHEIFGIRSDNYVIGSRAMYEGAKAFYSMTMDKLQVNPTLTAASFSVD